jgi:prolyl-tRNA synthetase
MRLSKFFWQTYKETPADAEIASHKLLLRAGMIHKIGAGLYSYLPMGLRVIRKIENIIREELENIGASELVMNFVTPAELWRESGRWDVMGSEMQRFKDQKDNDYCLSPTNEETITDIFKKTTNSYKQLPVNLFQITTKYRNEIRPRFGLMRGKEFSMKDAYTFSLDKACLDEQYENYYQAYSNIFKRMNLDYIIVEADGGNIATGESKTHEFQVLADSGEDQVVYSKEGNYAANIEKAQTVRADISDMLISDKVDVEAVETKGLPTCEEVATFLKIDITQTLKTLVFTSFWGEKSAHYMIMLIGDDDLNEVKLKNFLKADRIEVANEKVLKELNIPKGYMSPYKLEGKCSVLLDSSINEESSYVVGANKVDFHIKGFSPKRDIANYKVADLRMAKEGDTTSDGKPVNFTRGIEVGHIFQLGDKYSKAMGASVLDQNGKKVAPLMGCYGIGVTRTLAAAIEQCHDENGIIWPYPLAPFQIHLAAMAKSNEFKNVCDEVYNQLTSEGYEVLYDDRGLGMGAMMKDADLLGLPIRVFLGERDYNNSGEFELTLRKSGEKEKVKKDDLISKIKQIVDSLT